MNRSIRTAHQAELIWQLSRCVCKGNNLSEPFVGVELGVYRGDTSNLLLEWFPGLHLYCVDPMKYFSPDTRYAKTGDVRAKRSQKWWDRLYGRVQERLKPYDKRVKFLRMMSVEATKFIQDFSVDFIFIDGDHSFDGVVEDVQIWTPKLKSTGLLCGHDYDNPKCPDVKKAIDSLKMEIEVGIGYTWFQVN